jgi:predicted metallopeptidase
MRLFKKKSSKRPDWSEAPDIQIRVEYLVKKLDMKWVKMSQIHCYRSLYTTTRAYARIWGLSRIWQLALKIEPNYIIEVISEKYDKLSTGKKDEILLHELTHIPRNFSGALVPHTHRKKGSFHDKLGQFLKEHARRI